MLLDKLKAGTRNTKIIKFPGTNQDVALKVLSLADIQDAAFATERLFKEKGIEQTILTINDYEGERTSQILFRALRDPQDTTKPFASSVDEFKKLILSSDKDVLVDEYVSFEKECSPNLSEQAFESLLTDLKKSPEELAGSVLNITTARKLIVSLVAQLQNSQQASGSTS